MTTIEAEKLLIAYSLQGRDATRFIADTNGLAEDDISDNQLRMIFGCCIALYSLRKEVDALSVQNYLRENVHEIHFTGKDKKQELERLETLCTDIASDFPFLKLLASPYSAIQFVKEEAQRRKVMERIFYIGDKVQSGGDVETILNVGISELLSLSHSIQNITQKNYVTLSDAIKEAEEEIKVELSGEVNWLSTGLPDVDRMIHGLHNERLYIIGAEAKVGKSLLSNQIALHNAKKNISVGIVSMEMSAREIVKRFAGISQWSNPENKQQTLETFKQETKGKPIYFRQGGTSTKSLFSILQNLVSEKKCKLIVLDYLQLIQLSEKSRNAVDEINTVLSELKSFAVENQIPIILVCALLTKQIANKSNKKPSRADVAGTGRAINDCDCMLMMWNPEEEDKKNIEIFVEHGRNGEQGKTGLLLTDELQLVPTILREAKLKEYKPKTSYGKNW